MHISPFCRYPLCNGACVTFSCWGEAVMHNLREAKKRVRKRLLLRCRHGLITAPVGFHHYILLTLFFMVPLAGIEPARDFSHEIFLLHTLIYSCTAILIYGLQSGARLYHANNFIGLGSGYMLSTHLQIFQSDLARRPH